jgi:pimeloyl-ACP methyl ester carboxylesterase
MNRIFSLPLGLFLAIVFTSNVLAADATPPFEGERTAWHDGFDRYDFVMDEETLAITPFKAPDGERFGVRDPAKSQRRCIVVVPKTAAPGNPWSWQGCYWDHQPQAEVELLRRGFHIAYISANATLKPGKEWDAWYQFLTEKHGLSKKPAFIGMSRGGEYAYTWATNHPEQVSCIYADNPGGNPEVLSKLGELAKNDVPLLHVCGSLDPILGRYSMVIEGIYQQLGGRISTMTKDGAAHHPHSLRDPKPIADFIDESIKPVRAPMADFAGEKFTRSSYYSIRNIYRDFPKEGTSITCRGPWFAESYDRIGFQLPSVKGAVTVIVPKIAAAGKPWVYRADFVGRDAAVDLALLANGFHIVTGPVPFDNDNLSLQHWNAVYQHLTDHGFSKKPVMEGAGRAAGEAYAWAIENPDKVSCIYGENPVLRCTMSKTQPMDNLAPLAKAGVPLLHVCGSLDPALNDNTRALERKYKDLGGHITVIIKEGDGHYPLAPKDPAPVVAFILAQQETVAPPIGAAGQFVRVDYPGSTVEGELQTPVTYTLWIPDNVKTLRGLIVHQHGAGTTASIEGGTAAYDLHWQALAKKGDCALLGPSYHVSNEKIDISPGGSELWFDPRRGSEKVFLKSLDDLAVKSEHPELPLVPWALWGHSGGGIWADVMATLYPDRVAAVWMRSGSAIMFLSHPEFTRPSVPAALYAIPMMCNPGVKEKPAVKTNPDQPDKRTPEEKVKGPWLGNLATFREYRAQGGLIGFAPDPRTGHECGDSRYLAIPFIDACLAMRLPDKGAKDQTLKPMDTSKAWLAPLLGDEAQRAASFKGDPNQAVWLPNESVAKAWMEYVKAGAVSDATPPPAPSHVQAAVATDQGAEITWRAEADLESGIGGFIVLRDGQELATVPAKPVGKFGRPLFQSMTYHDTPAKPLAQMRYRDASAKPGEKHAYSVITVNSVGLESEAAESQAAAHARNYQFDAMISREVLENYLSRAITMEGLLNGRGDLDDNVRMLKSIGAKFIGRSLCLWAGEANLLKNLERAKQQIPKVHAADPEMILQACIFEIVTTQVEQVPVPDWAFTALGRPVEKRNFRYADMLYPDGKRKGQWGSGGSVPDVSQPETQMWFYFLAASYIDIGIEAIHFGQVELMNANDRDLAHYFRVLALIRSYAASHARHHMILCDAHVPGGGLVHDGKLLMDFHSFPLRIMEVADKPELAILKVGFSDGLYNRSKGGQTPSGWTCDHLPYLVELDNWGVSRQPGKPKAGGIWIWGYDEISWFAHQSKPYRAQWLQYATAWVRATDPSAHLQMPGSRTVRSPLDKRRWYYANNPGPAVPDGLGDEEAIRAIWASGELPKP